MRSFLNLITLLAWSLWFGATIATFVFGLNFFHAFQNNPTLAGQAASSMFHVFGTYELILAAITLAATSLLLVSYPSPRLLPVLAVLILASGLAMTFALGLSPRIETLRLQGQTHSEEFRKLHGKSMILMTLQSTIQLITAPLLLRAQKQNEKPETK
jgi:hypothetical protein